MKLTVTNRGMDKLLLIFALINVILITASKQYLGSLGWVCVVLMSVGNLTREYVTDDKDTEENK